MTCIYVAWEAGIKYGHYNIRLLRGPVYQQDLLNEYIEVEYDEIKSEKVVRTIQKKISLEAYISVYYASLSHEEDALQAIYDFLRLGFKVGPRILGMKSYPEVLRMMELKRKVGNEAHLFREFIRFTCVDSRIYIGVVEPKSNVIMLMANHFADRMPSEYWIILDEKRRYAVIHPKDEDYYRRELNDYEFNYLMDAYQRNDEYTDMWKTFFEAIGIKERKNKRCQRNMFPVWMRKNAVEFK